MQYLTELPYCNRRRLMTLVACVAHVLLSQLAARAGAIFNSVHSFSLSEGMGVNGIVLGSDGNFYGTTGWAGPCFPCWNCGYGTIFRMATDGTVTTLYSA